MITRKRVGGSPSTLGDKAVRLWWAGAICLVLAVASILLVWYHAMPLWAAAPEEDDELAANAKALEEYDWIVYWKTNDRPAESPNEAISHDPHPNSSPDDPYGSGNSGPMKIFPGKITHDDQYAPLRRYVLAVAEWKLGESPPTEMYFRLWDVDDPSADGPPIDTRPIVEPGEKGPDNWVPNEEDPVDQHKIASESDATKHYTVAVPRGYVIRFKEDGSWEQQEIEGDNAERLYMVEVKVGMQPGDNYRFTASPELANLQEPKYTQENADAAHLPDNGRISKKLTVWRKLHMEIDSMPEEPDEYPQKSPDIKEVYPISAAGDHPWLGVTTLYLNAAIGAPDEDHYEGGYIRGQQGPTWRVVNHTENLIDPDEIIILGVPGVPEIFMLMGLCRLADDDEPDPQLPLSPGVGPVIVSRFGKAYIEPVAVDDSENTNKIVPKFYLNLGPWEMEYLSDWTARDLPASQEDYWVGYIVMGYQGENLNPLLGTELDLDPDGTANFNPPLNYAVAFEQGYYGAQDEGYAVAFVETSRDAEASFVHPESWPSVDEIMTHETGHLGGAPDRESGIMHPFGGMKKPSWFSPQDIAIFRTNPYFKPVDE